MAKSSYFQEMRRPLLPAETELLFALVRGTTPMPEMGSLAPAVVGRCGCGACPTIFIGQYSPGQAFTPVADYAGHDGIGPVGVALYETDGQVTQLEVYSLDGYQPCGLPASSSLHPLASGVSNPTFQRAAARPLD